MALEALLLLFKFERVPITDQRTRLLVANSVAPGLHIIETDCLDIDHFDSQFHGF